jgi:hypothetical protein
MTDETTMFIVILALIVAVACGWCHGHTAGYQEGIAYQINNPSNGLHECRFSMTANFQGMDHSGYYLESGSNRCVINLTKVT